MMTGFFACDDCGNVILAEPERLYAEAKDCPACLSAGERDSVDPFKQVEITDA